MSSITLKTEELQDAIDIIAKISKQTDDSILNIFSVDSKLSLSTRSENLGIKYVLPATSTGEFAAMIESLFFNSVIRGASGDEIVLTNKGSNIDIKSDQFEGHIPCYSDTEITFDAEDEIDQWIELPDPSYLSTILKRVKSCAIFEGDTRPELNAVFLTIEPSGLVSSFAMCNHKIGTASFKLGETDHPLGSIIELPIPLKSVDAISTLADSASGSLFLGFNENKLVIQNDTFRLSVGLLTSKMPEVTKFLVDSDFFEAKFKGSDLKNTLSTIQPATRTTKSILFVIGTSAVEISASEVGLLKNRFSLLEPSVKKLKTGFHFDYLKNVIFHSGEMSVKYTDAEGRFIFSAKDDPFNTKLLLMPVRLL